MTVEAGVDDHPTAPDRALVAAPEELIIKEARQRHRRRLLAVAGIVVVVLAIGATVFALVRHGSSTSVVPSVTPHSGRPASPSSDSCRDGQITVTSRGGLAGAGSAFQTLGFVNSSKTSCTLTGYPTVVAFNGTGGDIAKHALNGWDAASGVSIPPTVNLAPGQMATAEVTASDIYVGSDYPCPQPYSKLLVTPPGSSQSVAVTAQTVPGSVGLPACRGLIVLPLVPGDTAQPPTTSMTFPPGGPPLPPQPSGNFPATTVP